MSYNFLEIEKKWQNYWLENKVFKASDNSHKPKYYVLDMFPYEQGFMLDIPLAILRQILFQDLRETKDLMFFTPWDLIPLVSPQNSMQLRLVNILKQQLKKT